MATPDYEHQSTEVEWSIQPNYVPSDNYNEHVCAMTGFSKRPAEVVYRGPHIDDFMGFFTIGQDAAEQLARLIGFVDPDEILMTPSEELIVENESLRGEISGLNDTIDRLRDVLS
jgi:hypothetical protein